MASPENNSEGKSLYFFRQLTEASSLSKPLATNDVESADPRLEDGMPLPKFLRPHFPKHLLGIPIEEIDPFYCNKNTFIVVGTNWVIRRHSSLKTLWFLSPFNAVRWFLIRAFSHVGYRIFMIFLLLFYTIYLTFLRDYQGMISDELWLIFFVPESVVKILAYGFALHPFSYIRNPWNILDFSLNIFMMSSLMIHVDVTTFSALRLLRLIHSFTYSRVLFSWINRKMRLMTDLFIYIAFILCLLTIHSLLYFQNFKYNACVRETTPVNQTSLPYDINVTSSGGNPIIKDRDIQYMFYRGCSNISEERQCPEDFVCLTMSESRDNVDFSHFLIGFLQVLRAFTHDDWKSIFWTINYSFTSAQLNFVVITVVMGYLLTNMIVSHLAAIVTQLMDVLDGKKPNKLTTKIKNVKISTNKDLEEKFYGIEQQNVELTSEKQRANADEKGVSSGTEFSNIEMKSDSIEIEEDQVIVLKVEGANGNDDSSHEPKKDADKLEDGKPPSETLLRRFRDLCCLWNCCSCCATMQRRLSRVVLHPVFEAFICLVIASNVVMLSLEHYPMSNFALYMSDLFNIIFVVIYVLEAVLKMLGLTPYHYFKDPLNCLDFVVVQLLAWNYFVPVWYGVAVVRILRFIRLVRWGVTKQYAFQRRYISSILIIMVFILVFALFGLGFPNGFADLSDALLAVIGIICGYWSERATYFGLNPYIGITYVVNVLIFGSILIFVLFIIWIMTLVRSHNLCETPVEEDLFLISKKYCTSFIAKCFRIDLISVRQVSKSQQELCELSVDGEHTQTAEQIKKTEDNAVPPCCWNPCYKWMPWCESRSRRGTAASENNDSQSLFWQKWVHYRRKLLTLTNHRYYIMGMNTFIVISSIPLFWENVHLKDGTVPNAISIATNILVVTVFSADIFLQIMANGCKNYFTNGWTLFDIQITLGHLIALLFEKNGAGSAMRMLRLIPRTQRLRVVISALFYKSSLVLEALFACGIFWILFTVRGINLFHGNLFSCFDDNNELVPRYPTEELCRERGYTPKMSAINFDHFGNAFIALLQVVTMNGWKSIFLTSLPYTKKYGLITASTFPFAWFYVFFGVAGLLCLAFLLSAFIKKANEQKKEISGYVEILMSDDQRKAYSKKRATLFVFPKRVWQKPTFQPFVPIYRLVVSFSFRVMVIITLILNLLVLCATFEGASANLTRALTIVNVTFYFIFVVEVALRLIGLGTQFFKVPWNIFDLVLIVCTAIDFCLELFEFPIAVGFSGVGSLLRVFRLARWLKPIRRIQNRINDWMPVFANIGLLMFVLTFTFAVLFMKMYGHEPYSTSSYNDNLNFETFLSSYGIFLQISLGSYWDVAYEGLEGHSFGRCMIVTFMLLSVFIMIQGGAVIFMDNYHFIVQKLRFGVVDQNLEDFTYAWRILDPDATGFIPYNELSEFVNTLPAPLQIPVPNEDVIAALDIPIYKNDKVSFKDVLLSVLSRLNTEEDIKSLSSKGEGESDEIISSTLLRQQENQNPQTDNVN